MGDDKIDETTVLNLELAPDILGTTGIRTRIRHLECSSISIRHPQSEISGWRQNR
jgi:hypothetical protein